MSIGEPIARADGPIKVTGAARFAGDQNVPGQLHAVFVTATIPAGQVTAIDAQPALAMPGVVRVLTAADMPRLHATFDEVTVPPLATKFVPMQSNEIAHEGQAVAIVLAETLEAAEASAKAVRVAYAPSDFVNPEIAQAVAPSPERGGYFYLDETEFTKGDAQAAIAAAPVTTIADYTQLSRHANPIEPSAILATWNGDNLTVFDSVQHLPAVQSVLAATFGIPDTQVRVISPHTGGGFGVKGYVWPHELLAAMAARVVRRPVKLVLRRQDMYNMVGMQAHIIQEMRLGAETDGTLVGISHIVSSVTGVTEDYVEFATVPGRFFYASDNIETRQVIRRGNVTLPTYVRSPSEGSGTWALGAVMDELARTLNIDPLDLRLTNYAETDPVSGDPWSSKMLREAYEQGAERFGWRSRPEGGTRDGYWRIGYGMADCGMGSSRFGSTARVRLRADGTAQIESSFCDIGCGTATIFPQIAADILGLDSSQVLAVAGDSDLPYAGPSFASATTISTGTAVHQAAQRVRERLARLASWPADEMTMQDGRIVRGEESRTIGEVLTEAGVSELEVDGALEIPGGEFGDAGLPGYPTRTFGAIFVEVGVDPDLGLLRLRRATGVYSAGRIINPRTAHSQMIGGIIWGWGIAAMEGSHYEPTLGRWLAKDLAYVPLPVNADIPPEIDVSFVDEFDANSGPLGAKGIGELGTTGVAAAVANAVYDAIGLRVRDLPITPEKLVQA